MTETMKSLQYETKAIDVTEKGIVTVGVNGIGIEDVQHDISMPGSFKDTLKHDIAKMRWFLNHDTRQLLGVPLSGEEKEDNVIMTGKINLDKQIGRDVYNDYKLFAEAGRTLEHSIGVKALLRDENDRRKVLRWKMLEYSTLTGWGANPNTYLVGLKSATADQVRDAVEFVRGAFKMHGYSDERLKQYDMTLETLLKSLNGGAIVTCPCCGQQFDYDSQEQHTFSSEVQDYATQYVRWMAQDIVARELRQLQPEIRDAVLAVIDSFKGDKSTLSEKSITDLLNYVRCPHCYSRVYRTNALLQEEPESGEEGEKQADPTEEGTTEKSDPEIPSPSFWAQLNNSITK
jgi:HK97 family phage prohead protease